MPVGHQEYVKIPGPSLAAVDGRYQLRITEEMREVTYIDETRLVAVDHPSEMELLTNDKFKSPPFPEFRLFGVKQRSYPKTAHDEHGRDVLAACCIRIRLIPTNSIAAQRHRGAALCRSGLWGRRPFGPRPFGAEGLDLLVRQQSAPGKPRRRIRTLGDALHSNEGLERAVQTVLPDMGMPAGNRKNHEAGFRRFGMQSVFMTTDGRPRYLR